ncbi:tRNA uridine-5-carboxymethylaminomethyl(34) synthesis GTPase MnmE [Buchnera aphidicola]|uniref:tRNA uridine-5-carboxymethylaminomethyl(34) synthesis GTPase MnmE n=1 Tax=Buchnera aphidicola TaxID=9 RepID=UPI003BEF172E
MTHTDTIIALVTASGKSAVSILRISGSQAHKVALAVLGKIPFSRLATYSHFLDQNKKILDQGIAIWFPSPNSFTGEDILELQGHGSPIIVDLLIKRILLINNVRLAKPGEFSERAFLNGKIDLIQAEAIDDLINSETEESVRSSLNSLQGIFSFYIKDLMSIVIDLRTNIEVDIDFSEEDININLENIISLKMKVLYDKFEKIRKLVQNGKILKEGKNIVIAGLPNAGKSSLFNILSYSDRAIVTTIPGTTRDVLYEYINIDGMLLKIIDTAGLRETKDEVESIGIKRGWNEIKTADHVLFVIDNTINKLEQKKICDDFIKNFSNDKKITFILNKNDIVKDQYKIEKIEDMFFITISAHTGQGIDLLRNHLNNIEKNKNNESIFIARRRHLHQIDLSFNEFNMAKKQWKNNKNIELLANSLNIISQLLGEIIGQFKSHDLLNRIFSEFCIGK